MPLKRPLILSALPHDIHAHSVCWALQTAGIAATWISSWADGALSPPASLHCDDAQGLQGLGALAPGAVSSVWYRRPRHPDTFPGALEADLPFLRNEWGRFENNLHAMAGTLTDALWVNHPAAATATENKLLQLHAARECGLRFPATLMSSDPAEIRRFAARHGRVVYKPFQTHTWQGVDGKMFSTYARIVDADMLRDEDSLRLCPGIYQALVEKRCDVRITIVGERLFPVRIDTPPEGAFIDWRASTLGGDLRAMPFDLTVGDAGKLQALMRRLKIAYGCVDLAIDAAGDAHFLEVNQAGQFLFLEEALPSMPILSAVSAMLAHGATDYPLAPFTDVSYARYLDSDEHAQWWDSVKDGIKGKDGAIPGVSVETA